MFLFNVDAGVAWTYQRAAPPTLQYQASACGVQSRCLRQLLRGWLLQQQMLACALQARS
jgi:hypothetical protein